MPKTTQQGLIDSESWGDYRWHLANRIVNVDTLRGWIDVTDDEAAAIEACAGVYRWSITPYYAALMDPSDPECPVRRQAVPRLSEFENLPGDDVDPVGDRQYRKTNRVVHKYPDRAIFLVTRICPVYCRHCTRKFHTTNLEGTYFGDGEALPYDEDIAYIASHREIRDVLLTGGDPLSYSDARLDHLLGLLRAIPHVEILRIGTRFPVLLPQRITPAFCEMLERHHPVWVSTHFNHPKELTSEAEAACDRLLRAGVPVQNQTVLLRGVNDDVDTMRALNTGLVRARIRPYYLYHCDNVTGVSHFQTSLDVGRDIMRQLEWSTTGFAIPEYVITTTIGKIRVDGDHLTQVGSAIWLENAPGATLRLDLREAGGAD